MVLYWNKELFNTHAIAGPPLTWDETLEFSKKITKQDVSRAITVSGIAFGRANNIPLFRDIIALLLLQQGSDIADEKDLVVFGGGDRTGGTERNPAQSVLRFYTDFSNPGRDTYTWNPALPKPEEHFVKGSLGMMLEYASRYGNIKEKAPHLAFDVAKVPQLSTDSIPVTVAQVPAIVVSAQAKQKEIAAWQFALWLTEEERITDYVEALNVAPARRDILRKDINHEFWPLLKSSALQSKWIRDPIPKETHTIIREMIESVASAQLTISEAVSQANLKIKKVLK